jgi:hypothetical protein
MKGDTVKVGYVNRNDQRVLMKLDRSSNHRFANGYALECKICERRYKANGCDVYQRKCPDCQGGEEPTQ